MESTSRLCELVFSGWKLSSGNRGRLNPSEEMEAYKERKALRAANPPKTLSQKMNDATKRSREKKAAAPPRPKPTDHKPKL